MAMCVCNSWQMSYVILLECLALDFYGMGPCPTGGMTDRVHVLTRYGTREDTRALFVAVFM